MQLQGVIGQAGEERETSEEHSHLGRQRGRPCASCRAPRCTTWSTTHTLPPLHLSPLPAGCTLKKTATAVVVGIYGEGVPHGGLTVLWLVCRLACCWLPLSAHAGLADMQGFNVLAQHLPVDVAGDCNVVVENLGDYLKEQGI